MGLKVAATAGILVLVMVVGAYAADPELTTDFFVPDGKNAAYLEGDFFTFCKLRNVHPNVTSPFATVTPVNSGVFEALTGLGVSYALLQFPPNTVNRPHTHPRGTEAFLLVEGSVSVGLLDSDNKLRTQNLQKGDIFVFPRGLVHFQINVDPKVTAVALGAFSSSAPGTITLPLNLFGSKGPIDDNVLAKSFQVSVDVIKKLKLAQQV